VRFLFDVALRHADGSDESLIMSNRSLFESITQKMVETISEDIFRDPDPEATEWWAAIRHVWRYQRKKKRAFLKLWMDDTLEHRNTVFGYDGLATVYGGTKIESPFVFDRKRYP